MGSNRLRMGPAPLRHALAEGYRRLRGGSLGPARATGSVFVGLFVGMQPWFGLHLPICLGLSFALRLDAIVCYAAANVSNPLLAPLIVAAEIETGRSLAQRFAWMLPTVPFLPDGFGRYPAEMVLGALALGLLVASVGATFTGGMVLFFQAWGTWRRLPPNLRAAMARVRQRYAHTERSHAWYVALKLWTDPMYRVLPRVCRPRSHVTDLGCGRGQTGLLLLELGLAERVLGLDWDAGKIAAAQRAAAAHQAEFSVADLASARLSPTDQVLLLDVLHYLTHAEQTQLLEKVARVLRPSGMLVIRDVDGACGRRGRLARICERMGVGVGLNRGKVAGFRSVQGLAAELERLGFGEVRKFAMSGFGLDNQLLLATWSGQPMIGDTGES